MENKVKTITYRPSKLFIVLLATLIAIPIIYSNRYFLAGILLDFSIRRVVKDAYTRTEKADYNKVLEASRYIMNNIDSFKEFSRKDWNSHQLYINFSDYGTNQKIPKVLRDLKPGYIMVDSAQTVIVMLGGFVHLGLRAFPVGITGYGTRQLIPGLWLQTEERQ